MMIDGTIDDFLWIESERIVLLVRTHVFNYRLYVKQSVRQLAERTCGFDDARSNGGRLPARSFSISWLHAGGSLLPATVALAVHPARLPVAASNRTKLALSLSAEAVE
jgi:hypothetical protein